ncbi:MAPEG family protein [Heliomarina baculiformis]|uniref:MAPEG family protein n=1 Tax=Heliomarina baculiformis TaxID=2872036 RepID=UPI001EE179B7|nr:MAPEG family protein [Heliomarina baculiformis]
MTTELTVLTLAALLQFVQFLIYSVLANKQVGPKKAMGPRDTKIELSGYAGRAQRALNNHFEGLILFTIAVLVVTLGGQSTGFTQGCAWVYLVARVFYVPTYLMGLTPWRSVIWTFGLGATVLMLLAALV